MTTSNKAAVSVAVAMLTAVGAALAVTVVLEGRDFAGEVLWQAVSGPAPMAIIYTWAVVMVAIALASLVWAAYEVTKLHKKIK